MADHIQCENILMSERGVFEVQAGKQVDGVLRADIDLLRVAYATGANRPFLEGIMGAVLFAAGLKGLWLCFQSIKGFRYYAVLLALGIIGAAMLWDVLQRRYVLYVRARSGRVHKLSFSVRAYPADIEDFFRATAERFGLKIDSDVPDIKV